MISFDRQYIFIHIPKTAGKSIYTMLDDGIHNNKAFPAIPIDGIGRRKMHLKATEIKSELGQERFDQYYKFAFVRNPWDRMISEFFWRKLRPKRRQFESLEAMLDFQLKGNEVEDDKNRHFTPQVDYVTNNNGEFIVDFIGRFENLNEDFRTVTEKIGIHTQRNLPKLNTSPREPEYRKYYTETTREMVLNLYQQDIDLLQYSF